MDPIPQQIVDQYYVYGMQVLNLAPGAAASAVLTIEAGSGFEWIKSMGGYVSNNADVANPAALISMVDTSTGANVFSGFVYVSSIFGTGALPHVLSRSRVFAPNTTLNVTVQSLAAAGAANVSFYLQLEGRKLYGYRAARNT